MVSSAVVLNKFWLFFINSTEFSLQMVSLKSEKYLNNNILKIIPDHIITVLILQAVNDP